MFRLKRVVLSLGFLFFGGVDLLANNYSEAALAKNTCPYMFMDEYFSSQAGIHEQLSNGISSFEEPSRLLEQRIRVIIDDIKRIVEFSETGFDSIPRVEQEYVYYMFEFLKSQIIISAWEKLTPANQILSFDSAHSTLAKKFGVTETTNFKNLIKKGWKDIEEVTGSSLFVFNVWKNLLSKYKKFYNLNKVHDKLAIFDIDVYVISMFFKNIESTDNVFEYVAYWMYKRSRTLSKIIPDLGQKYKSPSEYSTSSFVRDNLIDKMYLKLQQLINLLSKDDFISFVRSALDNRDLVTLAIKDSESYGKKTYMFSFVESFSYYLDMYGTSNQEIFKDVNVEDIDQILNAVEENDISSWMLEMLEPENDEDIVINKDLMNLIFSIHYWVELNRTSTNSIEKKLYNNRELEIHSFKTIRTQFEKLSDLDKLCFVWFLVSTSLYGRDFNFIPYLFAVHLNVHSKLQYDKDLIYKFILDNTTVLKWKNNFIEKQFNLDMNEAEKKEKKLKDLKLRKNKN